MIGRVVWFAALLCCAGASGQDGMPMLGVGRGAPISFTYTYVNGCVKSTSTVSAAIVISSSSPTCAGYASVAAGDLIVIAALGENNWPIPSNTGTAVLTAWQPVTGVFNNGAGAGFGTEMYYATVTSGGTLTVTAAMVTGTDVNLQLAEYSSSIGWQSPALDMVISGQNGTGGTTCSSGTSPAMTNANDLIIATCQGQNSTQTWGAVSGYTARSGAEKTTAINGGWYDKKVTTTGTQSWSKTITSDQTTAILAGFKAGSGGTACSNYTIFDGSGGTSGSAPTATTINNGGYGLPFGSTANAEGGAQWTINGSAITFQTNGYHALASPAPNLCNGGQYADNATVGFGYSTTTGGKSTLVFNLNNYAGGSNSSAIYAALSPTVTATAWFCTTLPQTATVLMDLFAIYATDGSFSNVPLTGTGSQLQVTLETGSGTPIPISTSTSCASGGTWYQFAISWVRNGTSSFAVYDASGTQVGSTWTKTSSNANAFQFTIGNNIANSPTSGYFVYWDKIKLCYIAGQTCTFPLME